MPVDAPSTATFRSPALTKPGRIISVDVLRGFDMVWIIGGAEVMRALASMTKLRWLVPQFEHIDWAGLHFYDVIFPLFIFIVGVSLVLSLSKALEKEGRGAMVKRILRRTAILYFLGFLFSGGFNSSWPGLHFVGVLQRIAAAYLFSSLIFCFCKTRAMVLWFVVLLIGNDAVMTFAPMRDIRLDKKVFAKIESSTGEKDPTKIFLATTNWTSGKFDRGYNVANQIDFRYLPGFKGYDYYDPDGLLSTIPVIATCLLGVFAGLLLRSSTEDKAKVIYLLAGGLALIAIGLVWSLHFPIVKRLWSPSFVMVTGGISAMAMAGFYWIIEMAKVDWWCAPFIWVGMNSITIYFSKCIVDYSGLANRFLGGNIKKMFNAELSGAGDFIIALAALGMALWICRALYKRKIFLRI
ncbi:MAG: acyltransferase family protein [Limisphaerales bacterium]